MIIYLYNNHAMNVLKIKHQDFEVIEIIKDDTFKCEYKNKLYFVKKYSLENSDGRSNFISAQKVTRCNVPQPKLKFADKKTGYVVKEFLSGTLLSDYILDNDFDENIYKQIFLNSYMARVAGLNLD